MMAISQTKSLIETIEQNALLLEPKYFDERADALEFIEFHIIEPLQAHSEQEELPHLKSRIETLKLALEEIGGVHLRGTKVCACQFSCLMSPCHL